MGIVFNIECNGYKFNIKFNNLIDFKIECIPITLVMGINLILITLLILKLILLTFLKKQPLYLFGKVKTWNFC